MGGDLSKLSDENIILTPDGYIWDFSSSRATDDNQDDRHQSSEVTEDQRIVATFCPDMIV